MRNIGIVTELKNDIATIKVMRSSACGENCASCKGGCSSSGTYIEAVNSIGAEVGDRVVASVSDSTALVAAFVAYIIPLCAAMVAAVVFYLIGYGEAAVFLSAIFGLLAGSLVSKYISARCSKKFSVSIVKILKRDRA